MNYPVVPSQPEAGGLYAVLDANVLIPARLSDILFDLALEGLYQPFWQTEIEQEFRKNWLALLQKKHPDKKLTSLAADRRLNAFRRAAPEYLIEGHKAKAITTKIPEKVDAKDRHVAAAGLVLKQASRDDATARVLILSANVKDLAVTDMGKLGVSVQRPGAFIDQLYMEHPRMVARAIQRVVNSLSKPPYCKHDVIGVLRIHHAVATANGLARTWRLGV
jgi:hypothetical protein